MATDYFKRTVRVLRFHHIPLNHPKPNIGQDNLENQFINMKYFLALLVCIAVGCNAQYQQRGRFGGRFGGGNNGYSGFPSTGGPGYQNNGYSNTGNNGYGNNGNTGYSTSGNNGYSNNGNNGYSNTGNNGYNNNGNTGGCNGGAGGFDSNGNYCAIDPPYVPGSNGYGDFSGINGQTYPVSNSYSG